MKKFIIPLLTVVMVVSIILAGCVPEPTPPPATTSQPTTEASTLTPTPEVTYILSVITDPRGAGSISLSPAGGTYEAGTKVTLTAIPAQGYVLDHWSGVTTGTSSSVTVTMDSDKSVIAHFKAGIGSVVSGDVWEVKVVSVRTETTLKGEDFEGEQGSWSPKEEGHSFLVVEVLINNISTERQTCRSEDISITDSEEQLYMSAGNERDDLYYMWTEWSTTFPPGEFSEEIVFVVPNDARGFHFKFLDLPAIDLGQ